MDAPTPHVLKPQAGALTERAALGFEPLTGADIRVLGAVIELGQNGRATTVREVGACIGRSPRIVHRHLERLRDAGLIGMGHGPRTIVPLVRRVA